MAHVVTGRCIDNGTRACVAVCPIGCFFETDGRMVYIDQAACIDCLCCYLACPVEAIFPESALPPELSEWKGVNVAMRVAPDARPAAPMALRLDGPPSVIPGRSAATAYGRHAPGPD
jgi:NAD-dependent dihydropyrimidine dehydrogenase PreA subunit